MESEFLISSTTGSSQQQFKGRDGLTLVGDLRGDSRDPLVIFLHGGGQTRHSWDRSAIDLANRGWQTLTIDARGHGESDWSDTGDYRLVSFADDIRMVLAQFDQSPVLVGASLGGLASILLAGEIAPGSVRSVVLVDIVPQMEAVGADRIHDFMVDNMESGFGSLDEVADAVAAYNPHRPRPTDLNGLRKNVRERDGRFYWHWDPEFMNGSGGPAEIRDVERLHRATATMVSGASVMLVRGRASDLVSAERAQEFCDMFPTVEFADVSGAGHMVAGDRNDAFNKAIVEFLDRHVSH